MPAKQKSSKLKKALFTAVVAIVAIAVLVLVGARLFFRVPVISYYRASEKAFNFKVFADF